MSKKKIPHVPAPTPQAGEQWDFKFNRKSAAGPFGSKQSYPPATVLDVTDGWVRYAIGKAHPDLQKPLATFTYMYCRSGN